jgi:AraC-like DNA-binding protein
VATADGQRLRGERGPPTDEATHLEKHLLVATRDFCVEAVECRCGTTGWSRPEEAARHAIVFVRRGCFRRRLNGSESFVDPTVVYFERPDDEQQIAHPAGGDSCTVLYLADALLAALWGGEPGLPAEPVPSETSTDLRQRLLTAALVRGDSGEAAEAVISVAAAVLEGAEPERVASGRPVTAVARRRLASAVREALVDDPRAGVIELARRVAVSPHHLSRVFRTETGETISRYRNRLRVRLALDRLADGEPSLARLAAELGFADQAHLTRVVRREVGATPSAVRELLSPD